MKYITPEIWAGWQSEGAAFERAVKLGNRNFARYQVSLKKLAPKLGLHQSKFFTNQPLHDGQMLAFTICDYPRSNLRRKGQVAETSVRFVVLGGSRTAMIFHLEYTGVHEILVHTKNNLFSMDTSRFGDWGYDELLSAGRDMFRHNVLFQTGTEISVVFQRFKYSKKKATVAELRKYICK